MNMSSTEPYFFSLLSVANLEYYLVLQLLQSNNLCLVVVLFLGCCVNSYLTRSTCQTLSTNKMSQQQKKKERRRDQQKNQESRPNYLLVYMMVSITL